MKLDPSHYEASVLLLMNGSEISFNRLACLKTWKIAFKDLHTCRMFDGQLVFSKAVSHQTRAGWIRGHNYSN